jgi:hypothetical protein
MGAVPGLTVRSRIITLDTLRAARACPYGEWQFNRLTGGRLLLTADNLAGHVEWAEPVLDWIGSTLPPRQIARIKIQDRAAWRDAATAHGLPQIELPAGVAEALHREQVLRVLRAVLRSE